MPLFENTDEQRIIDAYAAGGRTLDDLPYTEAFEAIYQALTCGEANPAATRAQLFHRLHNMRKAKRLPRLGRAQSSITRIEPQQETLLVELVNGQVGELSKRDRLPYTEMFADIVTGFNDQTGLSLTPHQLWRIIAKLAK